MKTREEQFLSLLALREREVINEKEVGLVSALISLLGHANSNEPLDEDKLDYCQNKVAKVFCFEERYGGMVRYLEAYQVRYETQHQKTIQDAQSSPQPQLQPVTV